MPIRTPKETDALFAASFSRRALELALADAFGPPDFPVPWPAFSRPLGSIRSAEAAKSLDAVQRLRAAWSQAEKRRGWRVEWRMTAWRALRAEAKLPAHADVESARDLVASLHPQGLTVADWDGAVKRLQRTAEAFGLDDADRRRAAAAALKQRQALWPRDMEYDDFERLIALARWLLANPASGLFVREIPLAGIDTKWFERHRGALASLMNAVDGGVRAPATLAADCGLRTPPAFVLVRHAGPWTGGGAATAKIPFAALAEAASDGPAVAVIENEQTGLSVALPEEVPIFIGMGYGAAMLGSIPWLAEKRILYFGDLDTHGLAILAACRESFPAAARGQVESVLMTPEAFERWSSAAVTEPSPVRTAPEGLTKEEAALFERLSRTHARLEQERMPIAAVNAAFDAALKTL